MPYRLARAGFFTALLLAASSYQAQAVTFWIDSVVGVWTEASPAPVAGVGTNKISWGIPASGDGKSSYTFTGKAPPPVAHNLGTDFVLGTFTHANYPIYGNSITEATLSLTIAGKAIEGAKSTAFSVSSLFEFTHNETPNIGYNCCKDIVTAVTNEGGSKGFSLDGHNYVFEFTGFQIGGVEFLEFLTKEGKKNSAYLMGAFHEVPGAPSEVPLPAALPLFASVVAGGGLIAWRRKRKAAKPAA